MYTQPQFAGGGPEVRVRNTFIDYDDKIKVRESTRSQTEPPPDRSRKSGQDSLEMTFLEFQEKGCYSVGHSPNASSASTCQQFVEEFMLPPSHPQPVLASSQSASGQSELVPNDYCRPQPQTIECRLGDGLGQRSFIRWTVDARKLRGNDKQVVSPPFEICFGPQFPKVIFKLMIYPKASNLTRGGAAFKKSNGRGYIQLKCEGDISESIAQAAFWISIGSGDQEQPPRGPVSHNFSRGAVCGLPRSEEDWDFSVVVDHESMTFDVSLEILPQSLPPGSPLNRGGG